MNTQVNDKVLLPQEAAEQLGISVDELLNAAGQGTVPGVCLGGHWRFSERRLQRLREHTATAA